MTKVATTTVAAQANEATPPAALKTKRAALHAALPGETPVQAAIRATEAQREVMAAAYATYEAAEAARAECERALEVVTFPADLVVTVPPQITDEHHTWPIEMVFRHPDGREVSKPIGASRSERLESREAIVAHFGEDHPELQERLEAFDHWQAETAPLRQALEKAQKVGEKADRAWQRSYQLNDRLCCAILEAPAEPHEASQQADAYLRLLASSNGRDVPKGVMFGEEAAPLMAFLRGGLKRPDPTPPAGGVLTDPAADFDLLSAIDEHKLLREFQKAAIKADDVEKAEQHTEAMQPVLDRASELRAQTLAGLMGRVWLVEDWAPTADSLNGQDLEWKMVRSLLDDIKALYVAQEPRAWVGSKAVTAGWIAAGLAQRCGVFSASTDPVAIAAE